MTGWILATSAYGQAGPSSPAKVDSVAAAIREPDTTSTTTWIVNRLASDGFVDVAAVREGSRVGVRFQNTRYRDRHRALQAAAALVLPELAAEDRLVLVPTDAGVPLLTATYPAHGMRAGREVRHRSLSMRVSLAPSTLFSAPSSNSPYGRLDFVLHPWFEANFSNLDVVAARTGIAPQARIALRKGLTLSAQVLLTLHDDVPTGESRVRPGLLTVNQRLRLWDRILVSATAGSFNPDRYGVDVEARAYSPDGRFSAGAELALTGAVYYGARDWYYTAVDDRTALVDLAWRDVRHALGVRVTGGWFLPADPALRLDVSRQFGATRIGFFAARGRTAANCGVTLGIPLPTTRYAAQGRVRFRLAESFPWEYRYRARGGGHRAFRTGAVIDEELGQWTVP